MEKVAGYIRHLFVPRETNDYRAKVLHHDFLTGYLVFAFLFVFAMRFGGGSFSNLLGIATDITAQKLLELTNAERKNNALAELTYNEKLEAAARLKAQDMFAKNYWAHYSPSGHTPWDFIADTGYSYEFAGENLAKNFLYSSHVVDAWMASPTHRDNIVRKDFTEVGYAVVNGVLNGEETTLVVQMFAKPQAGGSAIAQVPQEAEAAVIPSSPAVKNPAAAPVVLAQKSKSQTLGFSLNFTVLFAAFLAFALLIDFAAAARLSIFRLHGKHVAHLVFLVGIIAGVILFVSRGAIL